MTVDESTIIEGLMLALSRAVMQRDQYLRSLTDVQGRCSQLLEELRATKRRALEHVR